MKSQPKHELVGGGTTPPTDPKAAIASGRQHNPLAKWTHVPFEDVVLRVHNLCCMWLRTYPAIEPWDVAQDVMVIVLHRNFGKAFDPAKASFEAFVAGVAHYQCYKSIRANYRIRARFRLINEDIESLQDGPERCVHLAEIREAVEAGMKTATQAHHDALARITERAEGMWGISSASDGSTPYVQEMRCRQRLRAALKRFE